MHRTCAAISSLLATAIAVVAASTADAATLPDGRSVTPAGFTTPVEGFASSEALSPDGAYLAVLSQDGGAIDIIVVGEHSQLVQRLAVPWASAMTWTTDGLYVTRGYSGSIARFSYDPKADVESVDLKGRRSASRRPAQRDR